MKCIVSHEIQTDNGFKVFEAGVDYPASEVGDREKYFEAAAPEKKKKIIGEVTGDDAT